MGRRIYLHIGLPKTGTTSLQEILWHNRVAVAAEGLYYPGADSAAHHRAAMDLFPERYEHWLEPEEKGAWEVILSQVRDCGMSSLISSELFAPPSPTEAMRALSPLSFAELHVVCTARDPARQVPSVWQENVKTRQTTSFPDFLNELTAPKLNDVARLFWDYQDLPRVLRTWGQVIPPERVHVVTVPPKGTPTTLLWQRFCAVLGLDPDKFTTDVPRYNFSMGYAESELVRRLNERLGDNVGWMHYAAVVKDILAAEVLSHRRGATKLDLPAEHHEWAVQHGQRFADEISASGYHVVGDLDDLLPQAPSDVPAGALDEAPSDEVLLDVALDAIAGLVEHVPLPPAPAPRVRPTSRLTDALRDLSQRHPRLASARQAYLRTKRRLPRARGGSA